MHKDRSCKGCGGLDEFLYELNWHPVYYCATCDKETCGRAAELIGPDQRMEEDAGE